VQVRVLKRRRRSFSDSFERVKAIKEDLIDLIAIHQRGYAEDDGSLNELGTVNFVLLAKHFRRHDSLVEILSSSYRNLP